MKDMKRLLLPVGLAALAITLALVAGGRLPHGWLPVVIGVIAGVVASLPTSLIIVWRVTRAHTRPLVMPAPAERPPTVIVMPPAPAAPMSPQPMAAQSAPRPQPPALAHDNRRFTIIGGQDDGDA